MYIDHEKMAKEQEAWIVRKPIWDELFKLMAKLRTSYEIGKFEDGKFVENEGFDPFLGDYQGRGELISTDEFDYHNYNRVNMTAGYLAEVMKLLGEAFRLEYDYLHEETDRAKIMNDALEELASRKKGS